ncbi:restriction endonuclease subunit S [Marinobacter sp. M216]|uniref:Restriction endonuclease subunit S n=1 Tax=Marinobacter albus TaxID=3030833 RepID=A0ABT7H9C8_9GAMM|nr:restriction endonuclease subunit S [Marinobacter sp. M216]MDK9556662.1 restriction endonuclease subunit S [Marinobacter sp. M216]
MAFNSTPQHVVEQNINGLLEIHSTWQRLPLSLISDVKNGFAFKSADFNVQGEGERLIRIRDVLPGDTKTYYSGAIPNGYWVNPDDIVVGMDGDFNLAWWQSKPALLNQRVCRLDVISRNYEKRFFYRVLPGYLEAVNLNTSSTTVKHLSSKTLNELLIPLPPLAEQEVIADKLDTLLAQVENTKTRLERIPQILKRFRQSVLAAAVSGRLTEEWRSNSDSYGHESAEDWKWPPVPVTWEVKRYPELVESRLGKMLDKAKNSGIPTKYLGNINVRWFDFNLTDVQEILVSETERSELAIRPGDVLICEGGEPGRCAIWDSRLEGQMVFQKALHRARVSKALIPEWLALNLKHDADSLVLDQLFTGTTIKHLTGKALKTYPLRVPPVEEQTEIVRRVDQLFAHADRIEQQVNSALARVNNLTQSILAKAFRGELTEQWRKDNPDLISGENSAEALLERVKAERAKVVKPKRTRKAKASA